MRLYLVCSNFHIALQHRFYLSQVSCRSGSSSREASLFSTSLHPPALSSLLPTWLHPPSSSSSCHFFPPEPTAQICSSAPSHPLPHTTTLNPPQQPIAPPK